MPYRDERASRREAVLWVVGTVAAVFLVAKYHSNQHIWKAIGYWIFVAGFSLRLLDALWTSFARQMGWPDDQEDAKED